MSTQEQSAGAGRLSVKGCQESSSRPRRQEGERPMSAPDPEGDLLGEMLVGPLVFINVRVPKSLRRRLGVLACEERRLRRAIILEALIEKLMVDGRKGRLRSMTNGANSAGSATPQRARRRTAGLGGG